MEISVPSWIIHQQPTTMRTAIFSFLAIALSTFVIIASTPKDIALVEAAQQFLETLDDAQLQQISFELEEDERYNWHYTPIERQGLPLKAMGEDQRQAAMQLLQLSLSEQGFSKVQDVMALENVLRLVEDRPANDTYRDPENYYFSVFGSPQAGEVWGWRLEGHHLSLNFSSLSNEIVSATPTFFGANPGNVPKGPKKGWRVLQPEEDLGREIVKSLEDKQLQTALIAEEAYPEIVTGTDREANVGDLEGLAYADMTTEQQTQLMQLIEVYYHVHRAEVAENELQTIRDAGLDEIHFAWAGGLEVGDPHYYRIQSPGFVIEYDNTQNNANHIHTVIRDLQNDWGENALKTHYEEAHK
ncbi:MAG: DUF3500 domain-containing protein [Cyclobacteriaceae bacterium]